MPLVEGTCNVNGRIAYCSQTPWIQNMTLKQNILFGVDSSSAADIMQSYRDAIYMAALEPDLNMLSAGGMCLQSLSSYM